MSHKHQDIREAVVEILSNIPNVRVYGSVFSQVPKEKLPIISVYTNNESAERSQALGEYTRTVTVIIAAYVNGFDAMQIADKGIAQDSVSDKLDALKLAVENLLLNKWETLGKLIYRLDYSGVDVSFPESDSAEVYAVAKMRYNAIYHQGVNNA
jgi:hypothetical protein